MDAKWYVVNVHSGCEQKVAASIKEQAVIKRMEDKIFDVLIPSTEEMYVDKKGKKDTRERKFFPGYILVKMVMSDDAWHLIKNNPNVSNFLGSRNKPFPVPENEVKRILTQMEEGIAKPQNIVEYDIGEQVRVCDGPFASFIGTIEEVDTEKARVKVSVSIFGRSTPVELEYNQIERI